MRRTTLCVMGLVALGACRSAPQPVAFENRVFYEYGDVSPRVLSDFEQRYPPLDHEQESPAPNFIGVKVLGGTVRFSRPDSWVIRTASNESAKRFIEYVSPSEVVFTISERVEAPDEPWSFVLDRYREQAKKAGAELLSEAYPSATWNAQARGFVVRRFVEAPKAPFATQSLEYLVRSEHRILLVQIVHQGTTVKAVEDEVLRAFSSMQVL